MSTTTDDARPGRPVPAPWAIWPALFAVALLLAFTRPGAPDPRWFPNAHEYYPEAEGLFYSWTIPALGIVWSFASLPARRPAASLRRRLVRTWITTGLGLVIVGGFVMGLTPAFNRSEVGGCQAMLMFAAHGLVMAMCTVCVTAIERRRQAHGDAPATAAARGAPAFALAGSVIIVLIGAWIWRVAQPDDPLKGMRGEARGRALLERLQRQDTAVADNKGRLVDGHWEGRNGSTIHVAGDQLDLQVPVPWRVDPATPRRAREKIVEFLNSIEARARFGIPREPWHAGWRTPAARDSASLVFRLRQPADDWPFLTLYVAAGELDALATLPWDDIRAITTTLVDEGYAPHAEIPARESRDSMRILLLWLAVQTARLADACEAEHVEIADGRTASDAFRAVAARARDLRARVGASGPIPSADLERLGDDAWHLAGENYWGRPGGCRVMDSTEHGRLNGLGYDIRTIAPNVK